MVWEDENYNRTKCMLKSLKCIANLHKTKARRALNLTHEAKWNRLSQNKNVPYVLKKILWSIPYKKETGKNGPTCVTEFEAHANYIIYFNSSVMIVFCSVQFML